MRRGGLSRTGLRGRGWLIVKMMEMGIEMEMDTGAMMGLALVTLCFWPRGLCLKCLGLFLLCSSIFI